MILKNKMFIMVFGMGLVLVAGAASAEQLKIAVVNSAAVVQESPQYKAAQREMKSEFGKRRKALQAEGAKLRKDIEDYQKNQDVMTSSDRIKKENKLLAERNNLQYAQQKFQKDLQKRERALMGRIMRRIRGVIQKIAKQDGYTLILQNPVYAAPSMDITNEVLKRLHKGSVQK